jgi:hypothetical protein
MDTLADTAGAYRAVKGPMVGGMLVLSPAIENEYSWVELMTFWTVSVLRAVMDPANKVVEAALNGASRNLMFAIDGV